MGQSYGRKQLVADDLPDRFSLERAAKCCPSAFFVTSRYHIGAKAPAKYDFESDGVLGKGSYSTCFAAQDRVSGRHCAIKAFHLDDLSPELRGLLHTEIEIHLSTDHPNIVQVLDVYSCEDIVHLVMERCTGGELYDRVAEQGSAPERDAARASLQMLRAVAYLHSHHIVHRDLKLDNFMYLSKDMTTVKLIDFGFARRWKPDTYMTACCGTKEYASPELLSGKGYTNKSDIWSLGIVIFTLLLGHMPFIGADAAGQISRGHIPWRKLARKHSLSTPALHFVKQLLTYNANKRPEAQEALYHPWIKAARSEKEHQETRLKQHALPSLQKYVASSGLRRAAMQVLSRQLEHNECQEIRGTFTALHDEGRGTIQLSLLMEKVEAHIRDLLLSIETNGSGEIFYSQLVAAMLELEMPLEKQLRSTFQSFDVDCSGTISEADINVFVDGTFEGQTAHELWTEAGLASSTEMDFAGFVQMIEDNASNRIQNRSPYPAEVQDATEEMDRGCRLHDGAVHKHELHVNQSNDCSVYANCLAGKTWLTAGLLKGAFVAVLLTVVVQYFLLQYSS